MSTAATPTAERKLALPKLVTKAARKIPPERVPWEVMRMYNALRMKNRALQQTVDTQEHALRDTHLRVAELESRLCTMRHQYTAAVERARAADELNATLVSRNNELWRTALGGMWTVK
jgi:hypothetical protein